MAWSTLPAALLALAAASSAQPAREEFMVHIEGARAGTMTVQRDGTGQMEVQYTYRDNGRGPDMAEQYRLGADERPLAYRVRGKATFDAVIDEEATIDAAWRSPADQGEEAATARSVFVPLESTRGAVAYAPDQIYEALGIKPFVPVAVVERRPPATATEPRSAQTPPTGRR